MYFKFIGVFLEHVSIHHMPHAYRVNRVKKETSDHLESLFQTGKCCERGDGI